MKNRRWITCALSLAVLFSAIATPVSHAAAAGEIRVFLDGNLLAFDVPPMVDSGRTLVPLRAIFEGMGAEVTWDQGTQTAKATWSGGTLALPVGSSKATVNATDRSLDVPAKIVNNRTLVPLRFVAEVMGAQVGWYNNSRTISINKPAKALIPATVTKVVDGDTVDVTFADGRTERVRLIGVDTPEVFGQVDPYGPEASAYTKEKLTGQAVNLEIDVEERDRYARLLAYVYLPNGTMFNGMLADDGVARMATFPPNVRYVKIFRALSESAREQPVGLWSATAEGASPGGGTPGTTPAPRYDPKGPDRNCTDFSSHDEAQTFYIAAGGPGADPHKLDSDRDGIACETLP